MSAGLPFFSEQDRLSKLIQAAAGWRGTPFAANSCSRGHGVSCQFLAADLYREAGHCDVQPPQVDMAHAQFSAVSLVEPWMDEQEAFESIEPRLAIPGDLLGFRLGKACHHLGVLLHPGVFIHSVAPAGVALSSLADATWRGRLVRAWRPVA